MFFKNVFALILFICLSAGAQAQADFCPVLKQIIEDAGHSFKNTKGKVITATEQGLTWETKIGIPGTIKSRLVSIMGLCYEGALFQTGNIDSVSLEYDKYKKKLTECLPTYQKSEVPNYTKELAAYKKILFLPRSEADIPPPHVSMEVDYYKPGKLYTIILYVWEH